MLRGRHKGCESLGCQSLLGARTGQRTQQEELLPQTRASRTDLSPQLEPRRAQVPPLPPAKLLQRRFPSPTPACGHLRFSSLSRVRVQSMRGQAEEAHPHVPLVPLVPLGPWQRLTPKA